MAIYFVSGNIRATYNEEEEEVFKWSGVINSKQPIVFAEDLERLHCIVLDRAQREERNQDYNLKEFIISALSQLDVARWLEVDENNKFFYWITGHAKEDTTDETKMGIAFDSCLTLDKPILSEKALRLILTPRLGNEKIPLRRVRLGFASLSHCSRSTSLIKTFHEMGCFVSHKPFDTLPSTTKNLQANCS